MSYRALFLPFILILSLLFAACAPAIKEISLSSKPVVYQGFSVVLPQEKGWMIKDGNPKVLVKLGNHNDETYVIEIYASDIPKSKSHEEIKRLFDKAPPNESDSERFRIISQESKKVTYKGQPAWRLKIVAEDRGAVTGKLMILEKYSFVVLHPQDKELILLSFSHRYYPGDEDAYIDNKVDQFFNSLEFINF